MSSDFKTFLSITIKLVLSSVLGFFWGLVSVGWVLVHMYATSLFETPKDWIGAVIFLPASISALIGPYDFIIIFPIAFILTYLILYLIQKHLLSKWINRV